MAGEFSVYQFFEDGSYEMVRQFVGPEEAVKAAKHYTTSVAARMGITVRVIITDGGDCTAFEWKYGEGVVFPPKEEKRGESV
jgi:hypothetical protein